ncbi:MAG: riboflavin synthase [Williamsia sp.]|nr:riboflavin synthase [Williamsia sp.]
MFTGIIEAMGTVQEIKTQGTNKTFWIESPLSSELKIDQSLSHNGVCLTVEQVNRNLHQVTAVLETLEKTDLGTWKPGNLINLERCMQLNGRLDGHLVQGHVDATARVTVIQDRNGSWEFSFQFPEQFAHLVIEKGSISLNGISLTVFNVDTSHFTVAIIPYTYEHTNLARLRVHDPVNLEFDLIGKYVQRSLNLSHQQLSA